MLVLLIIFMVLTPIMIYELSVNLPDKTETVEQEDDVPKDQLLLAVCKDGTMTLNRSGTTSMVKGNFPPGSPSTS